MRRCPSSISRMIPLYLMLCALNIILAAIWLGVVHMRNDIMLNVIWGTLVIILTLFLIVLCIIMLIQYRNDRETYADDSEFIPITSKIYQSGVTTDDESSMDSGISIEMDL